MVAWNLDSWGAAGIELVADHRAEDHPAERPLLVEIVATYPLQRF